MNLIVSNIKFLRKKLGFTQQAFADALGIKRSQLGSFEEGRATIKRDVLEQMAEIFNVDVEAFTNKDVSKLFDIPVYTGIKRIQNSSPTPKAANPTPVKVSPAVNAVEEKNSDASLVEETIKSAPEEATSTTKVSDFAKPSDLFASQTPTKKPIEEVFEDSKAKTPIEKVAASTIEDEKLTKTNIASETPKGLKKEKFTKEEFESYVSGELIRNIVLVSNKEGESFISMINSSLWQHYPNILTDVKALAALPVMGAPFPKNNEIFRAFQVPTDFQSFTKDSWLITKFLRNWFTLAKGNYYLISTQEELLLGKLLKTAFSNESITIETELGEQEINLSEVLEIWSIEHFYQIGIPKQTMPIQKIMDSLALLQEEVKSLKKV